MNKKEIDIIHAKVVTLKGRRCVTCGEDNREVLQCGHIFTRYNDSTRWDIHDLGNCHIQCFRCNMEHENYGRIDESPFGKWYIDNFGIENFDLLKIRTNELIDFTNSQLNAVYATLYTEYDRLLKKKYPYMILDTGVLTQ